MTPTIQIWGRRTSFNVQKVLWTLDELGLAYKHLNAGGSYGGLDEPEFRTMNPHGLVPVLRDEEGAVWESNAIVRYLCAKHSCGNLWQADPFACSQIDRWRHCDSGYALGITICDLVTTDGCYVFWLAKHKCKRNRYTERVSLSGMRSNLWDGNSQVNVARAYRFLPAGNKSKSNSPHQLRAVLGVTVLELSDRGTV